MAIQTGSPRYARDDGRESMNHWLFKSEPSTWSWEQQVNAGPAGTFWSGVRNHLAKQHMMKMKLGDLGFFYHSNEGKEIVGIVEVIREFYPDHTDETAKFGMVDVRAVRAFEKSVTLAQVKATPALATMSLITSARLSVQPVTAQEWQLICKMGGFER